SVKLDVIHQGQKKTVTITLEKYDREKMDKAKVNAIAAAKTSPDFSAAIDDNVAKAIARAGAANAGQPYVATVPGQGRSPIVLWGQGQDMQEMAKHMQELAQHAQEQAARAQEEAARMREQLHEQMLHGAVPGAAPDMNRM